MMGENHLAGSASRLRRGGLGSYVHFPAGYLPDWNRQSLAGMIKVVGDRVPMAKLITQYAVQRSYQSDGLNLQKVSGLLTKYAHEILGGSWCSGIGPYSYQCVVASELYVAYVEDLMLFIVKPNNGSYAKVNHQGVVHMC